MSARLFCRAGRLAGSECEIDREATLGTASDSDLVLSDPSLARQQARIRFDDEADCYFLEDLSGGKTALDGLPVEGRMRLDRLHVITFAAEHDFFFHWHRGDRPQDRKRTVEIRDVEPPPEWEEPVSSGTVLQTSPRIPSPPSFQSAQKRQTPDKAARPPSAKTVGGHGGGISVPAFLRKGDEPPARPSSPADTKPPAKMVLELDLPQGANTYPLAEGENVVGRSPSCPIFVEHHALSRRHAALIVDSATLRIRDLGSTNKTYVEGKPISSETEIAPGTPLAFAKIKARVRLEEDS